MERFIFLRKSFFYSFLLITQLIHAQQDSSNLILNRLTVQDILLGQTDSSIQQVISATRSAIPLSQSPFETYVITQEEIRHFGCNTLVDVLRLVPGIRTSKVGSAMEGELFMANGLRGNSYFQFLINDVPIRPYSTRGMALGAQLPIKQAERIEIQLGSAATEYGMLAGGGVINIILKESERPIYTSAELNFGNNDYNNIDVNFGGKIGKGKHIARFNAYGGYTLTKKRPINSDSSFYLPETYNPNKSYLLYANGKDWENVDTPYNALKYNLPHFSSYAGFQLKFRAFRFSFQQMFRREHSALGLNPSVLRYTDESDYYQDKISSLNIGFQKENKKYQFRFNTGFNRYSVAENSSSLFYAPNTALFLDSILAKSITKQARQAFQSARERLSERQRNSIAYDLIIPFYFSYQRKIAKSLTLGVAQLTEIIAYRTHFPYESNNLRKTPNSLDISEASNTGINGRLTYTILGKIAYQTDATFVFLDANAGVGDGANGISLFNNTRIGINQRIMLKKHYFYIRGNYNKSKLPINHYYHHKSIRAYTPQKVQDTTISSLTFNATNPNAIPQSQVEYQIAFQKSDRYTNFSIQYQYRKIDNIPLFFNIKKYNYPIDPTNPLPNDATKTFINGFDFNKKDYTKINHVKLSFSTNLDFIYPERPNYWGALNLRYAFTHQWGEESLNEVRYAYIRQMPKNISQFGLYLRPLTALSVGIAWNYSSSFYAANDVIRKLNSNKPSKPYQQFDVCFDYLVNDNLSLRLNINNAFNAKVYGIDATETIDDLLFNMQPNRYSQIGIVYNLDVKSKNIINIKPSKSKKEKPLIIEKNN